MGESSLCSAIRSHLSNPYTRIILASGRTYKQVKSFFDSNSIKSPNFINELYSQVTSSERDLDFKLRIWTIEEIITGKGIESEYIGFMDYGILTTFYCFKEGDESGIYINNGRERYEVKLFAELLINDPEELGIVEV